MEISDTGEGADALESIESKNTFRDSFRTLHSPGSPPNAETNPCTRDNKNADGSSVAKIASSCSRK